MEQSKFFCHYPFVAMNVYRGRADPCCMFSPKNNITVKEYSTHPEIIEVKKSLFQGQAPHQCRRCVEQEQVSGTSFRLLGNSFHPERTKEVLEHGSDYNNIKHLSVILGNTCNLQCLPCGESSFIRWQELHDLGYDKRIPMTYKYDDFSDFLEINFETLTLTGGEPFYDKSCLRFLETLVELGRSRLIRLDINTNLTNITPEYLDYLECNFQEVLLKGSIDGIGAVNDYLRYPSQWHEIERTVDAILARPKIKFVVTTALSNLSLLRYYELFSWAIDRGIKDLFISQVNEDPLIYSNIPETLTAELGKKYHFLSLMPGLSDRAQYVIDACQKICQNPAYKKEVDLVQYLDLHDQRRGTDWREIWPKLAEIIS